jgi:DNA-binding CsgD family transcriptional regulator
MFQNPERVFGGTIPMLGLIDSIYATVQRPELWDDVLLQISGALAGESIALFAGAPDSANPPLVGVQNIDATAWSAFTDYYASINPMLTACLQKFSPDETWYSDQALTDAEFDKTEFCNDYYKPNGMYYTLGLLLAVKDAPPASLSCQRKFNSGPFPDAAEIVCQVLRPHLQRALSLHYQMGALQIANCGLETALDAHEHAVIGLDQEGRVVLCNRRAAALALAGDGVRIIQDKLFCPVPGADQQLQALISATLAVTSGITAGARLALLVNRSSPKGPLQITATPFHSALAGRATRLTALVFLADRSNTPRSRATTMVALYGLTPTEARVADLLMQGVDIEQIQQRLHITQETYRFHVKRILAKTGTRKQSELMRLILELPSS